MHVYMTDREHNQTMLDLTARMVFDRASNLLADTVPVYNYVKTLSVLSDTAIFAGYSNTTINEFYQLLEAENSKNEDLKGWCKDD